MSPSARRPGWDGTAAPSEMTERAEDTAAPQEAKCNPMNPACAYYSAESPLKCRSFSLSNSNVLTDGRISRGHFGVAHSCYTLYVYMNVYIGHTHAHSVWVPSTQQHHGGKKEKLSGREQEMVFAVSILWYCNIYC